MRRSTPVVLVLLLVVSAMAAVPAAMAQQTETNETNATQTAPGAQLSGVVGVGEAELNGDVESRSYGIRIAQAETNESRAGVVADQLNATEQRVAELENERQELEAARANGSISEGQYRAQAAQLHVESQTVQRLTNQSAEAASGLPAETLEANGINATAIQTLSDRAANLTGPETAEIARSVAGPNAGQQAQPEEARNGSDRSDRDRTTEEGSTVTVTNETTADDSSTADDSTTAGDSPDGQ